MKSKNPFFSIAPSGSFAKTLVASNYRGKPYVSITHKPSGQPTENQRAVRDRFTGAKDAWLVLPEIEKEVYNTRAKFLPLTGYNLFIKEYEDDMLKQKVITITSAQILDLVANPIQLLPAPGVGKTNQIISFTFKLNYNSVIYSVVEFNVYAVYSNDPTPGGLFHIPEGFWLTPYTFTEVIPALYEELNNIDNSPIILRAFGDQAIDGDSDIEISLLYAVVDSL